MIRSHDIHARIAWPLVLERLGVPGFPSKKARPCPICGGHDRFVPDNRRGRGDYFCRGCGPGDGFQLLMKLHGWSFGEARVRVIEAAGLVEHQGVGGRPLVATVQPEPIATPSARVLRLVRECCSVADCPEAVEYLASRGLWPLPEGCTLKAHPSVAYFEDGQCIGRYAALLGMVRDITGELVSVHATYLQQGRKLEGHEPRKLLSPLVGRVGCAVQLSPHAETLGIAEGQETAIAAQQATQVPTWAALCTALLSRFEPPESVKRLLVFADRDAPGLEAAAQLMQRLQGRVEFEMRLPPGSAKDWNDKQERP